jgi:hypothetical protein
MLPYARLHPGPGFRLDRSAFYYAQRMVTGPRVRGAFASAIAAAVRASAGSGPEPLLAIDRDLARTILRRDGIGLLPGFCTEQEADDMLGYFRRQPIVDANGRLVPLDAVSVEMPAAPYMLRTVLECPGLLAMLNRSRVLGVVSQYLGCKPTMSSLGVRWSFPHEGPANGTQALHRDPDDWRFVKLFVYLTDVDEGAGPHVYVRGSHRGAGRLRSSPYDANAVEARYGRDNVLKICGPRGTSFIADTWGIHRGAIPRERPRLILQAQYSLLPVFAFKYEPLAMDSAGPIDPYVNRLLVDLRRPSAHPIAAGAGQLAAVR